MNHHIEITITADIPEDKDDAGHEAIVATKDGTHSIVEQLEKLGLTNVHQHRRLIKRKMTKAVP